MQYLKMLPRSRGLYVLIMEIPREICLSIGSLGIHSFRPGLYVYVGSARGPGGLRARIARHLRKDKKLRWHIDYLTIHPDVHIIAAVYSETEKDLEEALANTLLNKEVYAVYIRKFGSTDKKSPTHLAICTADRRDLCIEAILKAFREIGLEPKVIWCDEGPQPPTAQGMRSSRPLLTS